MTDQTHREGEAIPSLMKRDPGASNPEPDKTFEQREVEEVIRQAQLAGRTPAELATMLQHLANSLGQLGEVPPAG